MLANSNLYAFAVIVIVFWGLTLANLLGMKTSSWISTIGMILGTLIPGVIIIALGFSWIANGYDHQLVFSWSSLVPNFSNPAQLAILSGIALGFGGMEMPAVHAKDVVNPQRDYPRAIFLSATIIIALTVMGSLAIAVIVPPEQINLISGPMQAISTFLQSYNLGWSVPFIAVLITIGALGGVSTWLAGPPRGLLAAAQDGDFPPFLHKVNRHNMPVAMMLTQACIVTLLSLVFLVFPNVNSSFWILIAMAAQLYVIMYALMFISAIVLRYTQPDKPRAYRVPGGNLGMWIIAGIGLVGCLFIFIMGFFPTEQIDLQNALFYEGFLAIGILIFCLLPFLILKLKRPSWSEEA